MFFGKSHNQTILEISQGDYISATADSFLIDRQARELSQHTLKFYRAFLRTFIKYCNANSLTFIQQITPDFPRRYFLAFGEKHNPGGVHRCLQDSACIPPMAYEGRSDGIGLEKSGAES
jgi:hypothetical protein